MSNSIYIIRQAIIHSDDYQEIEDLIKGYKVQQPYENLHFDFIPENHHIHISYDECGKLSDSIFYSLLKKIDSSTSKGVGLSSIFSVVSHFYVIENGVYLYADRNESGGFSPLCNKNQMIVDLYRNLVETPRFLKEFEKIVSTS